jgi:hypothetical protein
MNINNFWAMLFGYLSVVGLLLAFGLWGYSKKSRECEKLNGTYAGGICFAPGVVLKGQSK